MLTTACARAFRRADRTRGEQAELLSRIEVTLVGRDGALAIAEGSRGEDYVVGIDFSQLERGALGVDCECPRFQGGDYCKHVWGTLRKLERHYGIWAGRTSRLGLYEIDASVLDVGPRDVPPDRRPKGASRNGKHSRGRSNRDAKKKPRAGAAAWKQTLQRIASEVQAVASDTDSDVPTLAFADARQQQQHWFVLSLADPVNHHRLQVDLMRSTRKRDGNWSKPVPCYLDPDEAQQSVDPQERAVLSLMKPAGGAYRAYHYRSETPSLVADECVLGDTLRALHATGRFAWKLSSSRRFADATAVHRVDASGQPWDLVITLEPSPAKPTQLSVSAGLRRGDQQLAIDAVMLASDAGYALVQSPVTVPEETQAAAIDSSGTPVAGKLDPPPQPGPTSGFGETTEPSAVTDNAVAVKPAGGDATAQNQSGDAGLVTFDEREISRPHAANGERMEQEAAANGEPSVRATVIRIRPDDAAAVRAWQQAGRLTVPRRSINTLMDELAATHARHELVIDPALEIADATAVPQGRCLLQKSDDAASSFDASLLVRYHGEDISFDSPRRWWWNRKEKRLDRRGGEAETRLLKSIPAGAFQVQDSFSQLRLRVPRQNFLSVVEQMQSAGWEVLAENSPLRIATDFHIDVASGVDWFDVHAEADFDGVTASLPELLSALRSGNKTVLLDDGSCGMLPEAWLRRFQGLEASGETVDDSIRFDRTQALLLDAMLAEQEDVRSDRSFSEFCRKLKSFEGIAPADPPESFAGELREYQRLGLGWFQFLREFGFGGCLADDMGLGKTIQVLAMLEQRRLAGREDAQAHKPSIAVVPKSLIFNWIEEAKRFTPELNVHDHTGPDRAGRLAAAREDSAPPLDLVLTTYGTLRRDAAVLREVEFDHVILDEAQAIKNPTSLSAKAARVLRGDHRLAMTGTPVENHLGDLWSLFDFLNPGMLGKAPRTANLSDEQDRRRIEQVASSLRPFILRRTKAQVLTELPEKVEQTLSCEMSRPQRKLYNQLKDHYRRHISRKVEQVGLKRSKIHVLEALLRLRQVACDPRLVDPDSDVAGAKIENLIDQLEEIVSEGHKALVFSQFTQLLGLVRGEIDQRGWGYEYLDGKTTKRAQHVQRFQEDDDCRLFLISLKAGGHGLNLTSADYVFILDPWWNPAVEAQAIDRTHRMGQTESVMAYRMICSDTVEEKIIELQQSKRDLADAIISQDKSLISELTAEDLQRLLS